MQVSITTNVGNVVTWLTDAERQQVPFAVAQTLNTAAFKVRRDVNDTMAKTMKGGATRWTLSAFKVLRADKTNLLAEVNLRSDGVGKARSFDATIRHLFTGGERSLKNAEVLFRRLGVLNAGFVIVPGSACPLDAYGNPPKALIVQLVSYFQAFGEQGYRANAKDRTKAKLAQRGKSAGGYASINGVEYFISRGKGNWFGKGAWKNGHQQHLPAGIWSRTGIHGSDIKPIFMFVRKGTYRRVVDLQAVADRTTDAYLQAEFNAQLERAIGNPKP